MAPSNRQLLTQGDRSYAKKKTSQFGVDEVSYDAANRTEYLTGFRKRKTQRKERAQEKAKEEARLHRIAERKKIRDERKSDQEKENVRMNKALKDIERARTGQFSDDEDMKSTARGSDDDDASDASDYSDWEGLDKPGVLKKQKKKFVDEKSGAKTTVTIEAVSLDSDNEDEQRNNAYVDMTKAEEVLQESMDKAGLAAVYSGMAEPKKKVFPTKKPKKKFRYLSAGERRINLDKERSRAKAKRKPKE